MEAHRNIIRLKVLNAVDRFLVKSFSEVLVLELRIVCA
jgi:hypothetical protein